MKIDQRALLVAAFAAAPMAGAFAPSLRVHSAVGEIRLLYRERGSQHQRILKSCLSRIIIIIMSRTL